MRRTNSKVLASAKLEDNGLEAQIRQHDDGTVRVWIPGHRVIQQAMLSGGNTNGCEIVFSRDLGDRTET